MSRAGRLGLASAGAVGFALFLVSVGAAGLGTLLLGVAGILAIRTRHWLSLAGRSRVGARSEDEVRRTLAPLQAEGWRVRHALRWPGQGDIDSVAIAPTGMAFAIETKTRTYDDGHVVSVREQAVWLAHRRRRWCRRGALGVLCVVRARGVERVERDVLVVSIDLLIPVLRTVAVDGHGARHTWTA